jgi:hypothetical protein
MFNLRPAPEFESWLEGHRAQLPEMLALLET